MSIFNITPAEVAELNARVEAYDDDGNAAPAYKAQLKVVDAVQERLIDMFIDFGLNNYAVTEVCSVQTALSYRKMKKN